MTASRTSAHGSVTERPEDHHLALVLAGDSDPGFARGMAVTLSSALAHLAPDCRPRIYIIDCGLGAAARARLQRVVHRRRPAAAIVWLDPPDAMLARLPATSRFPPVVYSRLLIPELVPQEVRRAVYLDADLIVGRDVSELFSLDLAGMPLAAVRDFGAGANPEHPGRAYFNSGLLVIDVDGWRQEALSARVVAYADSQELLTFPDQDAMNAVIEPWLELDQAWNVQVGVLVPGAEPGSVDAESVRMLLARSAGPGVVLHFTVAKPWRPSQDAPASLKWLRHNLRSGWDGASTALVWNLSWCAGRLRLSVGSLLLRARRAIVDGRARGA